MRRTVERRNGEVRVKVSRCLLALLACCGALLGLSSPVFAEGKIDRSFGDDGVVDLRTGVKEGYVGVVRVGPRGDIYLTEERAVCPQGGCRYRIYLRRYTPHGRLDSSFGRVAVGVTDANADLTVDSRGRPLVALQDGERVSIRRFLPNGKPDPSFGASGSVSVACACSLGSIKVGPGDRPLLAAGAEFERTSPFRGTIWVFARLRQNGSLDRSLGRDGIVRHPMPGFYDPAAEVEPDGGALLYGSVCCRFPSKPFVQRMAPNGKLRKRYAAATTRSLHGLYGTRRDDIGWSELSVVELPGGAVQLFGGGYRHSVVVGLRPDGSRSPSFAHDGVRTLSLGVSGATGDGRGGTFVVAYRRGYEVMRMRPDGRFDRSFGAVDLPRASNEEGLDIFPQGKKAAIVFDRGIPFCRQGCEASPKLYRVLAPRR
jgi:hypothetical protein